MLGREVGKGRGFEDLGFRGCRGVGSEVSLKGLRLYGVISSCVSPVRGIIGITTVARMLYSFCLDSGMQPYTRDMSGFQWFRKIGLAPAVRSKVSENHPHPTPQTLPKSPMTPR